MTRGTTVTHVFNFPFSVDYIKTLKIVYGQNDREIFHKNKESCILDGQTVKTRLSQKETFKFNHEQKAQIQVRCLTKNDDALISSIKTIPVGPCLDDEVLK